ncbi:SH3-domain-containing protein [Metschnikowia bicuspidata var. bicuspidata NRRL YB-4993]|uniref:SH3-domain-containing protein n=1 Tax=Metschnikowia bicuspidata var. bicuspidata NRRL YB-4993 TaxID=869754 RepID=A0A1A0HJR5_9ASCO|nr:SH3-domain-containing protein [Metschnikowia bicuspidata var. bicuspidata NRRL YB-4993]OBA24260.1 SH3-domain-containing protein [Metschnikowia bicuspidata var. bicuspidata NRRL YB-4993]
MSAALINRSLTNVRTELEFLYDSEVIDKLLFDSLMLSLPKKYAKDMSPWGLDKVPTKATFDATFTDSIAESLKKTLLRDDSDSSPQTPAPVPLPERTPAPVLGYCQASYDYESSESGDLKLVKGDVLAVVEHLSLDWWKGYKKGSSPAQAGVFPSNYVTLVAEKDFHTSEPSPLPSNNEKATYTPENSSFAAAPPMYKPAPNTAYQQGYQAQPSYGGQFQQPSYGGLVQQPSYGENSQFPPPSTSYNGQQQVQHEQQLPQQNNSGIDPKHVKKFGSKLGNAAIFGAGATIGSGIVNLIF